MFSDILDSFLSEPGIIPICLRLLCAMIIGLVIGTEREYTNRPAGMRTHILVAVGACVVALTGQMLSWKYAADPGRLAAQVITGVGFLGAGTIMREGNTVIGLTTAASLWTVACLGIAAGYGYYPIALCGMVAMFITLTILEALQHHLPGRSRLEECYALECGDVAIALELIHTCAKTHHVEIRDTLARRDGDRYFVTFHATIAGMSRNRRHDRFFSALAADPRILSARQGAEGK